MLPMTADGNPSWADGPEVSARMPEKASSRLTFSRKQHSLLTRVIERWRDAGTVDQDVANTLRQSIAVAPFDWQRLARYSFIIAVGCAVIAAGAVVADKMLRELLMRILNVPTIGKSALLAALAAGTLRHAAVRKWREPRDSYRTEAILFASAIMLAGSVYFLGRALDRGTGHFSLLFLLAAILYVMIGMWFPSRQVLVFGLVALGSWMGTETGYMSGYGAYFLGMNYPFRFAVFGACLTALGLLAQQANGGVPAPLAPRSLPERLRFLSPQIKVVGLLNLFVAFWILSICGNNGESDLWRSAGHLELLGWSAAFGAVAILAIWHGLRTDDATLRGFGLTFLCLNLYTRFFEYFWNTTHKAVFFTVLALTFWLLGTRAEKIWHLDRRPRVT
jgi:MFS family permease